MVCVWPADSAMFSCSNFLKPSSSAETLYAPSGSNCARYRPLSLLTTTRTVPSSMFVTVTDTPGNAPPDASVTVPAIVPLMDCDCANTGVLESTPTSASTAITPERPAWIPRPD